MYAYLISQGSYSDYGVEYIAIHEQKFTVEEMTVFMEEVKQRYIQSGKPTDYRLDSGFVVSLVNAVLEEKGFKVIFPIGEFHLDDFDGIEGLTAHVPWRTPPEPNPMRERST